MKIFGQFLFGLFLNIPIGIFKAYVFSKLWEWFIVTTFALESINTLQAFGIMIVLSLVSPKRLDETINESNFIGKILSNTILSFLLYCWILGIGWIVSLFF
jgi:hypothetical protein